MDYTIKAHYRAFKYYVNKTYVDFITGSNNYKEVLIIPIQEYLVMADDQEVLKDVWQGRIPVCFVLAEEDMYSMENVSPIYMMVPRITYFPVVTDKVQRQFLKYTKASEDTEIWLEYENQSLKWHYPVGLLFDLYGNREKLPWTVTVHFSNFPEDELLHCPSKETVESHLMAQVKEADCLKHRGSVVNAMQRRDHKQLWAGLQNDRFDQFWAVNRKFMESTAQTATGAGGEESNASPSGFRYLPCRLYCTDRGYAQRLVRPFTEDGQPTTFRDIVGSLAADIVSNYENYRFVVHGIELPGETPGHWLSEHMSYPDNFLHITAIRK